MRPLPNVVPFPNASRLHPDVLLGPSAAISRVWSQVRRIAPYFRTALLTGERGSGHEAVAYALHTLSPRSAFPLHILTGADAERELTHPHRPLFENATLFFPNVDRLSTPAQSGLVRLLRVRRAQQLAVVAATSAELRSIVSTGSFSSTLASLLSGLQVHLPALRDRAEDIPALATHLMAHEARLLAVEPPLLTPAVLESFGSQPWPGNLDQLHSVLRRMLHDHTMTDASAVEELLLETPEPIAPASQPAGLLKLEDVVQQHIRSVLRGCSGNKLRAAEILGISRSTLYRMLESGNAAGFALPEAV